MPRARSRSDAQAAVQRAAVRLSERDFQGQVLEFARVCGWRVYHTWNSLHSPKGYPDLTMVRAADRRFMLRELKAEDGTTTPNQDVWLSDLCAAGIDAAVWRPSDWPEIERLLR